MGLTNLHHVAIKVKDLAKTDHFYVDVLGFKKVDRPKLDFPGSWLQVGETMIHLYGGDPAKNREGLYDVGGAAVDHIAFRAIGFDDMKLRIESCGMPWRQNSIEDFALWQLFVKDPNDITIELNFDANSEPIDSLGPTGNNRYIAGQF